MALVTLSASYGAGGSQVGPALAQRLVVPFVDRILPTAVAARLDVPVEAALQRDECLAPLLERWLGRFAHSGAVVTSAPAPEPVMGPSERSYAEACEAAIREQAAHGDGVILGRAGAVVLRDEPGALHVRLDGPPERRVAQAMRLEEIDRQTAEKRMAQVDKAREAYVRHFYGVDSRNPELYHVVLDSTSIPLETCVDLIAAAATLQAG
jgi:hypothetical protein